MVYTVYILSSKKDGKLYIGQTNDVKRRLQQHQAGLIPSTSYRRPFQLIYQEAFLTRREAMKRERFLKKQKGGDVFKRILGNKLTQRGVEQ